ncbi:MAG: hypothetical protein CM15mP95_1070 [Alphaproteobacteria bacterium]|nr:MAG: hypothetical protein CM15mP95_1070 [Alphaproteobacteria bacterium]
MCFCKVIYHRFLPAILFLLLSQLTAYGHEMRPAIADIIVSPAQVSVTIRFNAELFLADIDASTIKDSDDAPNAAAYDRIRQLSPVALGNEFAKRWPRLCRPSQWSSRKIIDFCLNSSISPAGKNINLNLPRISTAIITAPMPAFEHSIRFWMGCTAGRSYPAPNGRCIDGTSDRIE